MCMCLQTVSAAAFGWWELSWACAPWPCCAVWWLWPCPGCCYRRGGGHQGALLKMQGTIALERLALWYPWGISQCCLILNESQSVPGALSSKGSLGYLCEVVPAAETSSEECECALRGTAVFYISSQLPAQHLQFPAFWPYNDIQHFGEEEDGNFLAMVTG